VTLYDLRAATHVVTFGCDVTPAAGQPVERWDVPAIADGYDAARSQIVANVDRLAGAIASR
jgi:hypothetical protein